MKDIQIVENLLLKKGRIIQYSDLQEVLSKYKDVNNKIFQLTEKGLLVNLKKGLYYISKIGSLGYTSISNYIIANAIGNNSFVSCKSALKYHGYFNQGLRKILSISTKQYLSKTIENISYEYVKIAEDKYFGYEQYKVDGGIARIATKERAILDIIEHKRSITSLSQIQNIIKNNLSDFDLDKFNSYIKSYSQLTAKTLGLLLDFNNVDTKKINSLINKKSTSRMSKKADKFNNKWRLYYHSILEEDLDD